MRFAPIFAVLAAAISLTACLPPATTNPVGTTVGLMNDPALIGLWRGRSATSDDDQDIYFHFLPTTQNTITVVMVQVGTKPDADWSVASITTTTLANNRFMNATMQFSDGKPDTDDNPHGTIPLLYRFEGPNRIVLYLMDEDRTKAAIRNHEIAGTVEEGQFGDATITAAPKDLDAFMASKKAAALFGERFATLTKIE